MYSVTLVLFVLEVGMLMYPLYCWYEQQQAIRSTLSTRSYAIGASNVQTTGIAWHIIIIVSSGTYLTGSIVVPTLGLGL